MSTAPRFHLADDALDPVALRVPLAHAQAGAYASFEGWVRDHNDGRAVDGLRYDAYAALAEVEGQRIADEALARFAILDLRCVHRIGDLAIGDLAVWVGVIAAHRDTAFGACRYVIDEVKARVPIWKHERYRDGDAGWLHPE
ncbi:molybdenum cofactor biosynthesis protein MoaE [Xanthomonas albilineans]|uniref:Molybdopterin synthase catalytic subunit n=1 Tax=Xanthomonas albilineans (strain GPE PC73 / CFBP 7063) TaxID=380358 RepID=D2UCB9_XANAP|nr:molybdenum cofactor biosynthesis protein MoaE [Xanthomonas albilineans]QHQ27338.1 putative molybdopterin-converting factor chain 2 protein [Xanthomonas albilineans]CBA15130.1 probable molybdopterin-converting factor chain 2 protein [Xanthomonas albilineans GPE PC73]